MFFMEIPLLLMLIIINFIIMKMEICPDMKLNVFFRDSQNRMWIGMLGGGFSVCNPSEDYRNLKFVHYSTTDGLVNNMVESIIEDKTGKIMDCHSVWFISFFT